MSSSKKTATMSDAAPQAEIEDVLISIRRLVSEDARNPRPAPRSDPRGGSSTDSRQGSEPVPQAAPEGRLVLTPALRVHGAPEAEVEPSDAMAEPTDSAPNWAGAAATEPSRPNLREPDADHSGPEKASLGLAGAPDSPPQETPGEAATEDGAPFQMRSALESKIAELEALIGDRQEEWDPEGEEQAAFTHVTMEWEDHFPDEGPETDQTEGRAAVDRTPEPESEDDAASVDWDEEVEADRPFDFDALRDAPLRTTPEVATPATPDGPVSDDEDAQEAAPAFTSARGAARRAVGGDEGRAAPQDAAWRHAGDWLVAPAGEAAQEPALELPEDAVIDEETLREVVAEIVRQELQGALGERITRNVRKLVRREIQRALASRDFE